MINRSSKMLVALLAMTFIASLALGQDATDVAGARTVVKRGLTGEIMFTHDGPLLQADPQQDLDAPMLLRLERSSTDATTYTARFIGSVVGDYDLRSLIQYTDGSPANDLDPIMVRIISELPAGLETDLYEAADPDVELTGGYKRNAIIFVLAWLAIPAILIARKMLKPTAVEETVAATPPPTLAEQLRPLVEAVTNRQLSIREQGRLELLLYHYWQQRLDLHPTDMAQCITQIRNHPEAGELLRLVESWLHRPEGIAHKPDQLDALLEPYRSAPAIADHELHDSAVNP